MPRCAREKFDNAVYHIIVKSISEIDLFIEEKDKDKYISIINKCKKIYNFKVYSYCFMTNHVHLIIDSNGADISKIMHRINLMYVRFFNHKYNRHGHLLQDRFKSKIIKTNKYIINLSAYIHKNPTAMKKYKNCLEKYKYSSLGVYLGIRKDSFKILDEDFIMQMFGDKVKTARINYCKMIKSINYEKIREEVELDNQKTEYKSERTILIRNFKPQDILEFVAKEMEISKAMLYMKNNKKATKARALAIMLMKGLCDFRCKDICVCLGNITQARVSELCTMGTEIMINDEEIEKMVEKFIKEYAK